MASAAYPGSVVVAKDVPVFFENFYKVSDIPDQHEEYCDFFQPNATFVLASRQATGREGILGIRHSMWTVVKARKHTVHEIYPFGDSSMKFMLHGIVEYQFKDGREAKKPWAAQATLAQSVDISGLQFQFYQVYLDTAA